MTGGRGGRRTAWVAAGFAAYVSAALVILLSPVSPEAVVAAITGWIQDGLGLTIVRQGWVEFAANVALFAPLGILVTLAMRRAWAGVAAGVVLSAGAEVAQLLLPGRTASARDVLANVLGAALGALLVLVVRALRRGHEKRMRLRVQSGPTLVRSGEGRPSHAIEPWSAP